MRRPHKWFGTVVGVAALSLVGSGCLAPGPPAPSCGMDTTSQEVLADLNASRAVNGLPPLAANGQLTCLAQGWSAHMAATNSLTHQDLTAILRLGFHSAGENILQGPWYLSAADINGTWLNSAPHRANMLSGSFSSVGIGLAFANGQVWATEDFGG